MITRARRAIVTPDGGTLIFAIDDRGRGRLRRAPLGADGAIGSAVPVLASAEEELSVTDFDISPDGRLLAYGAVQRDGRIDLFFTTFPNGSGQRLIAEGVTRPRFSRDGKELFFNAGSRDERGRPRGQMMSASVRTEPAIAIGSPAMLFSEPEGDALGIGGYDVAPDGRFLMWKPVAPGPGEGPRLVLVQNWIELMKR